MSVSNTQDELIETDRKSKWSRFWGAVNQSIWENRDPSLAKFKIGSRRYALDDSSDPKIASRNAFRRNFKENARRYTAQIILSLAVCVGAAAIASSLGLGAVLVAYIATFADDIGFYLLPVLREGRESWGRFRGLNPIERAFRTVGRTTGRILSEFGVAELLDSGSLRPLAMWEIPRLVKNELAGVGIAKLATDIPLVLGAAVIRSVREKFVHSQTYKRLIELTSGKVGATKNSIRVWLGFGPSPDPSIKAQRRLNRAPEDKHEYEQLIEAITLTTGVGNSPAEDIPPVLVKAEGVYNTKRRDLIFANAALFEVLNAARDKATSANPTESETRAGVIARECFSSLDNLKNTRPTATSSNTYLAQLKPLSDQHEILLRAAGVALHTSPNTASDLAAAVQKLSSLRYSPFAEEVKTALGGDTPSNLFKQSGVRVLAMDGTLRGNMGRSLAPSIPSSSSIPSTPDASGISAA